MLVNKLRLVGYDFVSEQTSFEMCKIKEKLTDAESIWDLLGCYNPDERKIYIYELCLCKVLKGLKISEPRTEAYVLLRELVRLHEHIHAYIHQEVGQKFLEIPPDVNESLTEFLSYCVIKSYEDKYYRQKFLKIFENIDQKSPFYYRLWRNILNTRIYKGPKKGLKIEDFCNKLSSIPSENERNRLFELIFKSFVEIIKNSKLNCFSDLQSKVELIFLCRAKVHMIKSV